MNRLSGNGGYRGGGVIGTWFIRLSSRSEAAVFGVMVVIMNGSILTVIILY